MTVYRIDKTSRKPTQQDNSIRWSMTWRAAPGVGFEFAVFGVFCTEINSYFQPGSTEEFHQWPLRRNRLVVT